MVLRVGSAIMVTCLLCVTLQAATPVTPNASPEARALLNFLHATFGSKILSGQMYAPWGINEISTVYNLTNKYPAISGHDFINESQNHGEVTRAIQYWRDGGIITFMWHQGAPTVGEGYEASLGTQANFNNLFVNGTNENRELLSDFDRIANHLEKIKDANVPVIWRPYHECSGGWFWWDKSGGEGFKRLWRYMFTYFTETKGLNNLIWFLGYDGSPSRDYDPGKEYYDLVGGDTYGSGSPFANIFNSCRSLHGDEIPIALHECGTVPNPDQCRSQNAMWMWWMLWHTGHLSNHDQTALRNYYNHELVLTRDELPNIMSFLDDSSCTPSVVSSYFRINDGSWQESDSVTVERGSSLSLGPHPVTGGVWRWSGPGGFTASTREVHRTDIQLEHAGDYTIEFINAGGCTTRTSVTVIVVAPVGTVTAQLGENLQKVTLQSKLLTIQEVDMAIVQMYDLRGGRVMKWRISGSSQIPLSSLARSGNYILTVHLHDTPVLRRKICLNEK